MKKLLALLTVAALSSAMITGCGEKKADDAVSSGPEYTVDSLMNDLVSFEWDEIGEYFEDENDAEELTSGYSQITDAFGELEELGVDEEIFEDLIKKIMSTFEYEITDTKIDGDEAVVECVISIPDFESIDMTDEAVLFDIVGVENEIELMEKYLGMTEEELMEFISSASEEDSVNLMIEMYNKLIPDLADGMIGLVNEAEKINNEATFTLTKDGDEWLVTELD